MAIFSWIAMTMLDINRLIGQLNGIESSEIPGDIATICFIVFVLFFYKLEIGSKELRNDFVNLFWKSFITSSGALLVLLLIRLFYVVMGGTNLATNVIVENFLYHVVIAFYVLFIGNLFYLFKRVILFQKSNALSISWRVFEIAVLLSLFTCFYKLSLFNSTSLYILAAFSLLLLALIFNFKWVAYLKFKQKIQSMVLILLINIVGFIFLQFIYSSYTESELIVDIKDNLTIVLITSFVCVYSIGAFLVLLFNLPTSSVFERKFEELNNFQLLSQQVGNEEDEHQLFKSLFETCMGTVIARAGWLEIVDEKGNIIDLFTEGITRDEAFSFKTLLRKNGLSFDKGNIIVRNLTKLKFFRQYSKNYYKSLLLLPVSGRDKKIGLLTLIRDVNDGFEEDMVKIVETFVGQTSIAVQNNRLLSEAFKNERIKENLKIAEKVQRSLLPKQIAPNAFFELSANADSAEIVGGDYYDMIPLSETKFAVLIADVSGKGTSAAFHAAQLKGIFHSIVQLSDSPKDFMIYANNALKFCLEKDTFITSTMLVIDTEASVIKLARAGHCPTLFYNHTETTAKFVVSPGPALGMFRNDNFRKIIVEDQISYKQGDILLLYTDGISEAHSLEGEEFGDEILLSLVEKNINRSAQDIVKIIKDEVLGFVGNTGLKDDYTLLALKFK